MGMYKNQEHLGTPVHFDYMVCNRKTKQHRQI